MAEVCKANAKSNSLKETIPPYNENQEINLVKEELLQSLISTVDNSWAQFGCNSQFIKAPSVSPSYRIADYELSNSYLLTHKIFSSYRIFYNLVKRVE